MDAGCNLQTEHLSGAKKLLIECVDHLGTMIGGYSKMHGVAAAQAGVELPDVTLAKIEVVAVGQDNAERSGYSQFELSIEFDRRLRFHNSHPYVARENG